MPCISVNSDAVWKIAKDNINYFVILFLLKKLYFFFSVDLQNNVFSKLTNEHGILMQGFNLDHFKMRNLCQRIGYDLGWINMKRVKTTSTLLAVNLMALHLLVPVVIETYC